MHVFINNFQCKRKRECMCLRHVFSTFTVCLNVNWWGKKETPLTQTHTWIVVIKCCQYEMCAKYLMRGTKGTRAKKTESILIGIEHENRLSKIQPTFRHMWKLCEILHKSHVYDSFMCAIFISHIIWVTTQFID